MKINLLLLNVLAAVSAAAVGAGPAPNAHPLQQAEIVAYMESTYNAKVTAIQSDASRDNRPHYHVLIESAQSGLRRLDVDAVTRKVTPHKTGPLTASSATLSEAAMLVATHLRGGYQVIAIEYDIGDGTAPHYDVDVRVPGGIALLKVDAATRWIGWRQPAVISDNVRVGPSQ
jgi:hypothetical protein